jgi:AraC-like DNA-binding protein
MQALTVSGDYVRSLLRSAEVQGLRVDALLEEAGIARDELEADAFSAVRFGRLYQLVMRETRDESFGMISAAKLPVGAFRMMCFACIHAEDLAHAIRRCGDFYELLRGSVMKPMIRQEGGVANLFFASLEASPEISVETVLNTEAPLRIRAWFSMWLHFLSWLTGQRLRLKDACFTFTEPEDAASYARTFSCPVRFDHPENALRFDAQLLQLPLVQTEQSLRAFLKSVPYQLIVMPNESDSLRAQVVALLGVDFSRDTPSAAHIAARLGMSLSSLRRRLQAEGTSYQRLKDECRQAAAMRYLASPAMRIQDVAELCGYDDPSTFFRVFKKWSGMTPGEYRRRLC